MARTRLDVKRSRNYFWTGSQQLTVGELQAFRLSSVLVLLTESDAIIQRVNSVICPLTEPSPVANMAQYL